MKLFVSNTFLPVFVAILRQFVPFSGRLMMFYDVMLDRNYDEISFREFLPIKAMIYSSIRIHSFYQFTEMRRATFLDPRLETTDIYETVK